MIDEDVIADKLRLTQVLLNILGNGVKFNKTGGTISVKSEECEGSEFDVCLTLRLSGETVRRIRRVIGDSRPIIILTAYD